MRPLAHKLSLFLTLLALGLAPACLQAVRKTTYAPSFGYKEHGEVKSTMWQLAKLVRTLNDALRDEARDEETRKATVLEALDAIALAAGALRGSAEVTNHPMLDDHLDDFLADVRRAREGVQAEPPRYFFAGNVTGACMYCHAPR